MNPFIRLLLAHPFLICSHRGVHGGNIIQNSAESIALGFRSGADLVEVDVCRSADGEYFLFHDGAERELYGLEENFHQLTSEFVRRTPLRNSLGQNSGRYACSLEEAFAGLAPWQLLNLDRSWFYWKANFLTWLEKLGRVENLLLKSPAEESLLRLVANSPFYYMPILSTAAEFELTRELAGERMVGVELIVRKGHSVNHELIRRIQQLGLFLFVNAETLDGQTELFGPCHDDLSLTNGFDQGWGELRRLGADIIQTDWPYFLRDFRDRMEEPIQAAIASSRRESEWRQPGTGLQAIAVYGHALTADGEMSPFLRRRMEKALELARTFPASKIIVSGGLPVHGWTESRVMSKFLTDSGIEADRILEDPDATDTVSNQAGILKLLRREGLSRVCLVSCREHIPRCLLGLEQMAQVQGVELELSVAHPVHRWQSAEREYALLQVEQALGLRNYLWSRGESNLRIWV